MGVVTAEKRAERKKIQKELSEKQPPVEKKIDLEDVVGEPEQPEANHQLPAVVKEIAPELYATGAWNRNINTRQINIDAPDELLEQLSAVGEGTKNLRFAYFYILGLAAAKIACTEKEVEITQRSLLKLMEELKEDPRHLMTLLGI